MYPYYVSQAIIQWNKDKAGSIYKIPADEIENLIKKEIALFLKDKNTIQEYISDLDVHNQKSILSSLLKIEINNDIIRAILAKVVLYQNKVEMIICKEQVLKTLKAIITNTKLPRESFLEPENQIKIIKNVRISTTSRNGSVLIVKDKHNRQANINPFLVKIIAKGYYWNKLISEGKARSINDIQKLENMIDKGYIQDALSLRILSPRIVEAIFEGLQPADLTVKKLLNIKTLDWEEQYKQLHFV